MKCPACGHQKTFVADASRDFGTSSTYRTRQCRACTHTWFTREVIHQGPLPGHIRIRYRPRTGGPKPARPALTGEERKYRFLLRREARKEAEKTGEDVEAIYQRWGVSTIRPTFRRKPA